MLSRWIGPGIVEIVAGNLLWCIAFVAMGCANAEKGGAGTDGGSSGGDGGGSGGDASCGTTCDEDHDGVVDGLDLCPGTSSLGSVNMDGCADSQVNPTLQPVFPSYGMTWTPTGTLGRAASLTWTYTGIERGDLFHIYWIVCDDPATPCGVSLDGPIDAANENWAFSATDSDLVNGKLVYTNTTKIVLADGSMPALDGRLTLSIYDAADVPGRWASATTLGVTGRLGQYGAEVTGAGFKVVAIAEVKPTASSTWTPYLDYYDSAPTPIAGGGVYTSFGGSFYDE